MSPHDLCALGFIEKLMDVGIACFKIEGRNRSPEYVATVTGAYREAVDYYCENHGHPGFEDAFSDLKKGLLENVKRVYNRGFSSGFYLGKPIDEWTRTGGSQATTYKEYVGIVTNYYKNLSVAEVMIHSGRLVPADQIMFQGETTGIHEQQLTSMQIEHLPVDLAEKGQLVAVKTTHPVRRGDKLFVVLPVEKKR